MAVPLSQMATVTKYVLAQKLNRGEAVSARVDAGTLIPLQFGLCRLRKDSISLIMCWISGSPPSSVGLRRRNVAPRSSAFPAANR